MLRIVTQPSISMHVAVEKMQRILAPETQTVAVCVAAKERFIRAVGPEHAWRSPAFRAFRLPVAEKTTDVDLVQPSTW